MPRTLKDESKINQEIGKRIEKIRIAKGFSRLQIAEKIGITHQQYQKYEIGANKISAVKLFKILNILEISFEDAFGIGIDIDEKSIERTRFTIQLIRLMEKLTPLKQNAILDMVRSFANDK